MIISHFFKKNTIFILFFILSGIFISLVWNNNVWMDEAFTASLVHTDFAGVIERSMADTLPPLYNMVLWVMTSVFGYTIPVMKITSLIPMIVTLVLGATVIRRRWGEKVSALFMLFVTFMPVMFTYGVEIRMYSMGFFFATASGVYAYEVACDGTRKNIAAFVIFSTLAGYTHHFAFVTAAFSYLYLLIYFFVSDRKRIRQWFICLGATFVLYIPCLIVTLSQISRVSGYFSMPDVTLGVFGKYMIYPFIVGITPGTIICMLIMAAALAVFVAGVRSGREDVHTLSYLVFCFVTYYGVLVFGTIVSKIMTANIFVDRYLFFATGMLWLFAAIVLGRVGTGGYAVSVIAAVIVGICTYRVSFEAEYGNTADEEIAFLRANVSEGDIYYSIGGHEEMQNCIPFYTYLDAQTPELSFVYPLEEAIKESEEKGTSLWISVLEGSEPSREDMEIFDKYGITLEKKADFSFDRYRCEMYKAKAGDL